MNKDLEIKHMNIEDLKLSDFNPRKINPKQKKLIRDSIKEHGFIDPVIVNINPQRKNIVIGGNMRVSIGKEMGVEQIQLFRYF